MKILRRYWKLILIFLIALLLRTFALSEIPVGLHGDEASIGYNAYSLLKTARDQDGHFLPLAFDQFGNFRAAGYHYIDIPFIAILGLNALSVRLPAAIFGALTVVVLYYFVLELFGNKKTAYLSSFLLAILPWHINLSRASSEAIISTFFAVLGMTFLLKGLKNKLPQIHFFLFGLLAFAVSIFFYHASAFFIPVFLPFLFLLSPWIKNKKTTALLICLAVIGISLLFLTIGGGKGRASQVSILSIPGGTTELKRQTDEEGTQNPLLTRFYHNKFYFYGRLFLSSYTQHFSGTFLFVDTGLPIRYKIPWTGNVYLIEAPFILLGFAFLLSEGLKNRQYFLLIPIVWLFIGAMPAGLTWEDIPNLVRSNFMAEALVMIAAFGFYQSIKLVNGKTRIVIALICALILIQNFAIFLNNYFYHTKIHEPWHRSASEPDLIYSLNGFAKNGQKIIMTTQNNNSFIFYLFYNKFDPATFQKLGSPHEKDGLKFKNITYTYSDCPLSPVAGNSDTNATGNIGDIFVDLASCTLPKNAQLLKVVRTPDGTPSFIIVKEGPPL